MEKNKISKEKKLILEIQKIYKKHQTVIQNRLREFKNNKNDEKKILKELLFCILTPQSKAKNGWNAILEIEKQNLLFSNNYKKILYCLYGVRFKNKKAFYLLEARNKFVKNRKINIKRLIKKFKDKNELREFFVKNIKGYGYKEASHFLRNIGFFNDFAILDRHILKNLKLLNIIKDIPKSLSKNKYLEIEKKMKDFSKKINVPFGALDLILWYKETNEFFK